MPSLTKIGTLKPKTSEEIKSSKISVGFECLDRKMWDDTEEIYQYVGELGVKWARIQSGWFRCEKEKGNYDFAWLDRIADKLIAKGIQPWICLCYGNALYDDKFPPGDVRCRIPVYTPEAKNAWCSYLDVLIKHFSDRINHYEVWNEPNFHCLPSEYAELVKITSSKVKSLQKGAFIIAGSMAYDGIDGNDFLTGCLKSGMGEFIDAYSYHAYGTRPELHTPEKKNSLREIFKAYNLAHLKLWQGENGCPSAMSPHQALRNFPWTEERQAKHLTRRLLTDLSLEVDLTSYFHFSDFNCYDKDDYQSYFGLTAQKPCIRRKPSYFAMRNICSVFDAQTERAHELLVEMDFDGIKESKERSSFCGINLFSKRVAFRRNNYPLSAWWYPSDLLPEFSGEKAYSEQTVNIWLWSPSGQKLDDPVLLDPLNGDIFSIEKVEKKSVHDKENSYVKLCDVPLRDYPMIATDKMALSDMI